MRRISRVLGATVALLIGIGTAAAQTPATIIGDVRTAIACTTWPCSPKQDLSGGEAILKQYRAAHGTTSEALEALSWLGRAALAANHVVVDSDTSHYVVSLLTLFARSDACYDSTDRGAGHRPLALMLAEAVGTGTREERLYALQRLGDVSLFTAGFFAEALHDRAVGLDYYVNMGGGAYRTLATNALGTKSVKHTAWARSDERRRDHVDEGDRLRCQRHSRHGRERERRQIDHGAAGRNCGIPLGSHAT